jgi:hypothetical protein
LPSKPKVRSSNSVLQKKKIEEEEEEPTVEYLDFELLVSRTVKR